MVRFLRLPVGDGVNPVGSVPVSYVLLLSKLLIKQLPGGEAICRVGKLSFWFWSVCKHESRDATLGKAEDDEEEGCCDVISGSGGTFDLFSVIELCEAMNACVILKAV